MASPGANALTSRDIGLVINTADPYSVEVGEFYIQARKLTPEQVLRVEFPVKASLTPEEFEHLKTEIDARFNGGTQALALAWKMPYAVACNSITAAVTMGYDPTPCEQTRTCFTTKPSSYFDSRSLKPYSSFGMRLSMLLAATDVAGAKALIERGVVSDRSLLRRGAPSTNAYFVVTKDRDRNSRAPLFPPSGPIQGSGVVVRTERTQAIEGVEHLVLYETGAIQVDKLDTLKWVPGALADHLTSFGGQLDGKSGQMSILDWIASGATASYGTVSEPCAFQQKFPHPKVLLSSYLMGSTAIEAYWRSVAWPQQGLFIGEPLAAPFARR
ncbi:TIGR03790 family protein [Piscinibacter terrae]|uniref:TIGR03790 family protein n=1 Tax=Piscinibacter terrae TaxID=2496871 RepID=UPI001F3000F8|nr:TIGR03790 family protein [Albitalea terrae]